MLINLASLYSIWLPVRLFSAGQQGVWYEPKPQVLGQQVLFQDSAGTTPVTADGQPVGYMEDLSGNGNHATQATAAAKPIYRTDGTLHWLEGDGVDDFLSTPLITLTDRWSSSWAGEFSTLSSFVGPWRMLRDGGSPTSGTDNRLEEYTDVDGDRTIWSRYESQGSGSQRPSKYVAATPLVAWANRNPGTEEALGEIYTGSPSAYFDDLLPYSAGTASLHLLRGFTGDFMDGKMHGYCFVTGGLTPEKRVALNHYMKTLAGVTL